MATAADHLNAFVRDVTDPVTGMPYGYRPTGLRTYLPVDKALHGLCPLGRPVKTPSVSTVGIPHILLGQTCSTVCYELTATFDLESPPRDAPNGKAASRDGFFTHGPGQRTFTVTVPNKPKP